MYVCMFTGSVCLSSRACPGLRAFVRKVHLSLSLSLPCFLSFFGRGALVRHRRSLLSHSIHDQLLILSLTHSYLRIIWAQQQVPGLNQGSQEYALRMCFHSHASTLGRRRLGMGLGDLEFAYSFGQRERLAEGQGRDKGKKKASETPLP